jgi:hypothetical protein
MRRVPKNRKKHVETWMDIWVVKVNQVYCSFFKKNGFKVKSISLSPVKQDGSHIFLGPVLKYGHSLLYL